MYHKFIAEGEKVVGEALKEWPNLVEAVFADAHRFTARDFDLPASCTWHPASTKDMERISNLHTPPGILAMIAMPPLSNAPNPSSGWLLYLDGIADPGNLGGILRSADWFGLRDIVLGPGTVEWSNPKVVQAAMGSLFRVQLFNNSLDELTKEMVSVPMIAADLEGEPLGPFVWPDRGILVLGGESHGLSEQVRQYHPTYLRIPGDAESRAESLNVHVAAGIMMAHWHGRSKQP